MSEEAVSDDNNDIHTVDVSQKSFKVTIVWRNVLILSVIHVLAIYGYYLMVTAAKWQTMPFAYVFTVLGTLLGITAGMSSKRSPSSSADSFQVHIACGLIVHTKQSLPSEFFS